MKPTLDTYGGLQLDPGYAGGSVTMNDGQIHNFVNTGALPIDFGVAVARGPAVAALASVPNALWPGQETCKAPTLDADVILGISARHATQTGAFGTDIVLYQPNDAVPVYKDSDGVYVVAYENVTVDDQALSLTAQNGRIGGTTGGAAGAGRVVIPGAVWQTTTLAGQVGIVRVKS